MNNFLENKQNLIMIGQSIIMLGVSVYFYKRIQAVVYNIGELHKMILNQQDQINKQNMVIENLRTLVLNNSEKNNKVLQEAKVFVKNNSPREESEIKSENIIENKVEENKKNEPSSPNKILENKKNKSRLFSGINSTLIFKNNRPEKTQNNRVEVIEELEEEEEEEKIETKSSQTINKTQISLDDDEEDEEDEDLDAELQNELRELEYERNLKKR